MASIPVIIDTDPGVDDILAILLALASPELQVLAIVVSYGNTEVNACYLNIIRLYEVLSKHLAANPADKQYWPNFSPERKPILASGAAGPLQGESHSAQYFHGRDGLGDITNRFPEFNPKVYVPGQEHPHLILTVKPGVDVILDLIRAEPERSITYIALGPMTTLAQVVATGGTLLKDRIDRVVCMGGALDVPGNTSPVAEYNFLADPFAVHDLLVSPTVNFPLSRFILLPLDITTPHEVSFPEYIARVDPLFKDQVRPASGRNPLVHFTSAFFERTREVMLEFGKDAIELHDIAAVWCAIAKPTLPDLPGNDDHSWKFNKRQFQIERVGEYTRGMLVIDRREDVGAYAPGSNRSQVQAELDKNPEFHPHGASESTAVRAGGI
ncbi:hypothetical protein EUX98_g1908 [Antrodiella citrinella]|uniref:Inosine/uridine-preferring nucleoside hydrolase domain-containing protein n=1 Tax=Antrodiella citrinella TaxID=2447956 RepID=A0A4S4N0A9_9APHY|nr:hypothetical protein EUX98_g1908 [Antrodiella citrinella]